MKRILSKMSLGRGIILLLVLNAIDGVSTHVLLTLNLGREQNPLLRLAWEHDPAWFWATKILLLAVGLVCLGRLPATDRQVRVVLLATNAIYLIIMGIHLWGWVQFILFT